MEPLKNDEIPTIILEAPILRPENTKGKLVMLDYAWLEDLDMSNEEFSLRFYEICKRAIEKSSLKIVHKNITFLPIAGHNSEEGMTLFFSLDSSHISAHLYWKSRLMALDVFGCSTDEDHTNLVNEIDDELKILSNNKILKAWYGVQPRFHFVS